MDCPHPPLVKVGRHILDHAEAEVLERRDRIGQRDRPGPLVQLQAQGTGLVPGHGVKTGIAARPGLAFTGQLAQPGNALRGFGGAIGAAIGQRESLGIARGNGGGARGVLAGGNLALDRLVPAAQHPLQAGIERGLVGQAGHFGQVEHIAQHGEAALDLKSPVEHRCPGGFDQHGFHLQAGAGRHDVARQPDEGEEVAHQRGRNQRQLGTRPVNQAHHRGGDALQVILGKADQQVVRQCMQCMDQRLAGMALGREAEAGHQVRQLRAHPRHLGRRGGQPRAGPDPGMDRQAIELALFEHRNDEQVERSAAVDIADRVGLDHQQRPIARALPFEPGEGAVIGNRPEQRLGPTLADAQRARLGAIAVAHDMAQLGQHPVLEPAQQRRALAIGQAIGIGSHGFLQTRPVGHGGADITQRGAQRRFQLAAGAGIGAAGFEVDHRFALFARGIASHDFGQRTFRIAAHRQHRVDQPVNRQALRRHGGGNRIDQERHVIVDHADPHEAFGRAARNGLDRDRHFAGLAPGRRAAHEGCRRRQSFGRKGRIAGQQRGAEPLGQSLFKSCGIALRGLGTYRGTHRISTPPGRPTGRYPCKQDYCRLAQHSYSS